MRIRSHRTDHLQHAFQVLEDFGVPESENTKAPLFEPLGARLVLRFRLRVLSAIEFDDNARVIAGEIDDETAERHLSAKAQTIDLTAAQGGPEPLFRLRHVAA